MAMHRNAEEGVNARHLCPGYELIRIACLWEVPVLHVCPDLLYLDHVLAGGRVEGDEECGHNAGQEGPDACSSQERHDGHPAVTCSRRLLLPIPCTRFLMHLQVDYLAVMLPTIYNIDASI